MKTVIFLLLVIALAAIPAVGPFISGTVLLAGGAVWIWKRRKRIGP